MCRHRRLSQLLNGGGSIVNGARRVGYGFSCGGPGIGQQIPVIRIAVGIVAMGTLKARVRPASTRWRSSRADGMPGALRAITADIKLSCSSDVRAAIGAAHVGCIGLSIVAG